MLSFSDNFFEREMRMDFTISSTMKCAWAAQLEVLDRVIGICHKHGLRYYAFWGTLLGAVRHCGFIPWDDDIDICMLREDYLLFLEVVRQELPDSFCILNVYEEAEYENTFTRITNGHEIDVSQEHLYAYHGCPFVVGVDIFPLDHVPESGALRDLQQGMANMISGMISLERYRRSQADTEQQGEILESVSEGIAALEEALDVRTDPARPFLNRLRQLFDHVAMLGSKEAGQFVTSFPEYAAGRGVLLRMDWFGEASEVVMPFENLEIAVPTEWDQVLQALFGNYMIPVRGGADHDYPFYKEQLQMLHEAGKWLDVVD